MRKIRIALVCAAAVFSLSLHAYEIWSVESCNALVKSGKWSGILLRSRDGECVQIKKRVAKNSKTLKGVLEDAGSEHLVPLAISLDMLETICDILEKMSISVYLPDRYVYRTYLEKKKSDKVYLREFLGATNYLDVKPAFKEAMKAYAQLVFEQDLKFLEFLNDEGSPAIQEKEYEKYRLANLDSIQRDLQRVIIEGYLRSIDRVFLTNTRDRRLDALKQLDLASAQVVAFIAKHETRSAQELPPFLRHLLEERKLADKILFGPMPTQYPISPAHCPLKSNKDYNMYSDENPDDRYINNGDGSVLDICTNFTWEINAPIAHPGSWAGWEALWKHCKGLRLGGCSQWRTQTSREYKTLIAFRAAPSIYEDEDLYDGPKIGRPSASAWRYSDDGIENADKENNALRCVCTEQMPGESSHLYSTTPETITDNFTGLVWQRGVAEGSKNYRNARGYCRTLRLGGHSDWRLPAIRELGGLVTYKTKLPQIDDAFKAPRNADEINGYYFWSSSPTNIPERSWVFKFGNRPRELPRRIVRLAFVRCVR